jgi:CRP-like cAMP-binding protein
MPDIIRPQSRNHILGSLPDEDRSLLGRALEINRLTPGTTLTERLRPVQRVWFPLSGLVSLTSPLSDGRAPEVLLTGTDGVAGVEAVLGCPIAFHDASVDTGGQFASIRPESLSAIMAVRPLIRSALQAFAHGVVVQLAQSVVCNALHGAENRCCRRLLTAHDRGGRDTLLMTEESLAAKLGVGRPAVNGVLRSLAASGLVGRRRGMVRIIDRGGIASRACECYCATDRALRRIYSVTLPRKAGDADPEPSGEPPGLQPIEQTAAEPFRYVTWR